MLKIILADGYLSRRRAYLGTQFQSNLTAQSDITATSQLGAEFSGIVEIDLSNADPAKGIIKLPDNVIDASQQITSSCNFDSENTFVVTGRGGIARSPQEFLRGQNILQDWRVSSMDNTRETADSEQFSIGKKPSSIQEAEKWIVNPQGKGRTSCSVAIKMVAIYGHRQ